MEGPIAAAEPQQTASRWEDYIDVFFSPTALFVRRAKDKVAPPLLTLIALGIGFYIATLPATQTTIRASFSQLPPEAQAQMTEGMVKVMSWAGVIGIPIVYVLMTVFAAAMLWLGGRIADMRTDFGRTMLIATYGSFIMLLSQIVAAVLIIVFGEGSFDPVRSTSFGVLRFVGSQDMGGLMVALLGRVDVFAIWQAMLWAIGLRVLYNVSTARATVIAAATWFLFVIPGLLGVIASRSGPAGAG